MGMRARSQSHPPVLNMGVGAWLFRPFGFAVATTARGGLFRAQAGESYFMTVQAARWVPKGYSVPVATSRTRTPRGGGRCASPGPREWCARGRREHLPLWGVRVPKFFCQASRDAIPSGEPIFTPAGRFSQWAPGGGGCPSTGSPGAGSQEASTRPSSVRCTPCLPCEGRLRGGGWLHHSYGGESQMWTGNLQLRWGSWANTLVTLEMRGAFAIWV